MGQKVTYTKRTRTRRSSARGKTSGMRKMGNRSKKGCKQRILKSAGRSLNG